MKFFVDIDGTICTQEKDYTNAKPIYDNIEMVNRAYDQGHYITYWTARGSVTGIDWKEITEKQFKEWGVKYHSLQFGKPQYDILLDDRAVSLSWMRDL